MTLGSGLMTSQRPDQSRFVTGKRGVAGEVGDLRDDIEEELSPMAAIAVEEWTNPALADTDGVLASVATTTAAVTHVAADLVGAAAVVLDPPRNLTLTCDDSAATWAGDLTATGVDVNGAAITEDITFTNNTTTDGVKAFARVDSLSRDAQVDASGNYEVGFGDVIGLSKPLKSRASGAQAFLEVMDGVIVGSGGGGASTTAVNQAIVTGATVDNTTAVNVVNGAAQMYALGAPATKAVDDVHAAFLGDNPSNDFPGPFTSPDFPRNIIATFEALWDGGDIVVIGTDQFDAAVSETLASNPAGATVGVKIFKTVASATKGAVGVAAKFVKLGMGDKLGIPVVLSSALGMLNVTGVSEAGTWDAVYHAITPGTTLPNGAAIYDVLVPTTHNHTQTAHGHTVTDAGHNHVQNAHVHGALGGVGGAFVDVATSPPNGTYAPATVPNGAHDYALLYEYDPAA